MSFANRATVIYAVWNLDVLGDDGDWTVNDRRRAGSISVRTDRQNKAGQWDVSNKAMTRALKEGHYLASSGMGYASYDANKLSIDGEDDGVIFIDDQRDGYPLLQLEYERHHDIEEKPKGLFDEPKVSAKAMSKSNPLSSLSTGEKVGIAAAGVAVVGLVGYFIWKSQQTSPAALAAAGTAPATMTPLPGAVDQVPPFVPGFQQPTGGQIFDPNLGGSLTGGSGLQPGYQGEVTAPQTQAGIPGIDNLSGTVAGG
jgi:hypothetical protein